MSKKTDKQLHPLFLLLSGPGTGKSRLLSELPQVAIQAFTQELSDGNSIILKRLQSALIFHVTFENGTSYIAGDEGPSPTTAIGTRMLWQLGDSVTGGRDWAAFARNTRETPGTVLQQIAENRRCNVSDLTVFLMVDGIQRLGIDKDGKLSETGISCLRAVADLIDSSPAFVIGACSATVSVPINVALHDSPQSRVFLQPPRLVKPPSRKGVPVFCDHSLIDLWLFDTGMIGRAVEALEEAVCKLKCDLNECNASTVMFSVRSILMGKYPDWASADYANRSKHVLRAVLSNRAYSPSDVIPETVWSVDDLVGTGLLWLENGCLRCAYVWLWLVAHATTDPLLNTIRFDYYEDEQHRLDPSRVPLGLQTWQAFEDVIARFTVLKSHLFAEGEVIALNERHAGAQISGNGYAVCVRNRNLQFVRASYQVGTMTGSMDNIEHEQGRVKVSDCQHLVLSAPSNPAGDAFCGLELEGGKIVREVFQYKFTGDITTVVSEAEAKSERKKAASDQDIFVLVTNGKCKLPVQASFPIDVVVDAENFKDYFGPFLGRIFYANTANTPHVNLASRSLLQGIDGIGEKRAAAIIDARDLQLFTSIEDAHQRTKVPLKYLRLLRCD